MSGEDVALIILAIAFGAGVGLIAHSWLALFGGMICYGCVIMGALFLIDYAKSES